MSTRGLAEFANSIRCYSDPVYCEDREYVALKKLIERGSVTR